MPRQGAAALSWSTQLVGNSDVAASDTIIFGGRDASGNYLSDVWLLRAYNASLTRSDQRWSGFGSGALKSGIDADGEGVSIRYMSQCAVSRGSSPTTSAGSPSDSPTSGSDPNSPSDLPTSNTFLYNTSVLHKSLAAVSVALFLPALVFYRLSVPSVSSSHPMERNMGLMYLGIVLGVAAYALGIVGLATSFTSIAPVASVVRRDQSSIHLQTGHSIAGLALFAGLYGLVPLLQLLSLWLRGSANKDQEQVESRNRADSAMEKLSMNGRAASPSQRSDAAMSQTLDNTGTAGKRRIRSWAGIGTWAGISGRRSNDTATATDEQAHTPSQRSFEVVNRPMRQRRASGNSLAAFSDPRPSHRPRNLSDMSWLDGRRSASGMV